MVAAKSLSKAVMVFWEGEGKGGLARAAQAGLMVTRRWSWPPGSVSGRYQSGRPRFIIGNIHGVLD